MLCRSNSSSSGTSVFAYDGDNLIEETSSTGTVVARYVHGLNIDEPLAMLRSGATSYYQADGLGSITSLSNSSGSITNTYSYNSFGSLLSSTGSVVNPFRFTARESDSESGLYFYRARYYDPSIGRFLSEDPIGFNASTNFYAYSSNSPTNLTDPSGLWDTHTHSVLYWLALKDCPGIDLKSIYYIQQESAAVDALGNQTPWAAPIHSMKAPFQSEEAAIKARDHWIDSSLRAAQSLWSHPHQTPSNITWEDLFADALHTITDSTSPAHMQNGLPLTWPSYPNALQHGNFPGTIEDWSHMTPMLLQKNIQAIRDAWKRLTGWECGCSTK